MRGTNHAIQPRFLGHFSERNRVRLDRAGHSDLVQCRLVKAGQHGNAEQFWPILLVARRLARRLHHRASA